MRRLVLVATVIAATLFTVPATAAAINKALWGPVNLPDGRSAFPIYRDLGVDTLQLGLNWDQVATARPANPADPADPAYVWPAELDQAVAEAGRSRIALALLVSQTPPWANGGGGPIVPPTADSDYAAFLTAAARRYPGVRRWMIWGEPNRDKRWTPIPRNRPDAPRRYATLLDAAYAALKRESSRNIVVGAMTFTAGEVLPADWVRWMRLPNGKPPRLDEWGHNPFSTRFPDLPQKAVFGKNRDFNDLDTLSREVHRAYRRPYKRFRRRGPKLWLSEFTIQSDHSSSEFNFFVGRSRQAKWLAAGFRVAHEERALFSGIGWIGLLDGPEVGTRDNAHLGLMTYEGPRKKPSYTAFKRAR